MGLTIKKSIKKFLGKVGIYFSKQPHKYDLLIEEIKLNLVKNNKGVLHIGAHFGQEAEKYYHLNIKVIWLEALPDNYDKLLTTIAKFPDQKAFLSLVGDENTDETKFYIASNQGASSSIFELGNQIKVKDLRMLESISLPMRRLDSLYKPEDLNDYKHWILDVQGAELKVLVGAGKLLQTVNSLEIEVSTREEYKEASRYSEIKDFLLTQGFFPLWEPKENSHEDILFIKVNRLHSNA